MVRIKKKEGVCGLSDLASTCATELASQRTQLQEQKTNTTIKFKALKIGVEILQSPSEL